MPPVPDPKERPAHGATGAHCQIRFGRCITCNAWFLRTQDYTGRRCPTHREAHPLQYKFIRKGDKVYYAHRLIMEQALGRPLRSDEHIHHKDGDTLNNDIANLQILSPSEHMMLTQQQRYCPGGHYHGEDGAKRSITRITDVETICSVCGETFYAPSPDRYRYPSHSREQTRERKRRQREQARAARETKKI